MIVGGRVRPAHTGDRVRVRLFERSTQGGYDEVARRWPTLDGSGGFSQSFFAKMPGDGAHETGYSGPKNLVVD